MSIFANNPVICNMYILKSYLCSMLDLNVENENRKFEVVKLHFLFSKESLTTIRNVNVETKIHILTEGTFLHFKLYSKYF